MITVNEYVADYEYRGDQDYKPNEHEQAMIEDAIEGYLSTLAQQPVGWVNGDELDNMLNDRSTSIIGTKSFYCATPLYRATPALTSKEG